MSPLRKITERQAEALEKALKPALDATVYIAMRYWHPFTSEAVERIEKDRVRDIVLLPLYPQYSKTTTGSSLNEWNRVLVHRRNGDLHTNIVHEYCEHPMYVAALVERINFALKRVPPADRTRVHLVFSAHGTPLKLVRQGDPYQQHVIQTYNRVLEQGRFDLEHHLCYQSKVGPEKWLEPSLDDTIKRLASEGVSHVIVVPVAFVSDHVETLWEINIETREKAHALGISYFDMVPALNTSPLFIEALADLVRKSVTQ
jgi:ferrochelatase